MKLKPSTSQKHKAQRSKPLEDVFSASSGKPIDFEAIGAAISDEAIEALATMAISLAKHDRKTASRETCVN